MPRPRTGYLYQRGTVWWAQLQYPPGSGFRTIQKSLRTRDRAEAEVLVAPLVAEHKRNLWEVVNRKRGHVRLSQDYTLEYPVGKTTQEDGTIVFATEHEVLILRPDGTREERINFRNVEADFAFDPENHPPGATILPLPRRGNSTPLPKPRAETPAPEPDSDLKLLDDFLDLQPRTKHYEADARRTWERWREFVGNRPLAKCTRADGQAFVKHLKAQDPAPAPVTLRKWISLLKAPIAHGLPKHDPRQDIFHRLIGKVEVQTKRLPLSEADMRLFRDQALPNFGAEERLLWTIMATTGMRPSEVAAIDEEFDEGGVRYWIIGRKSATSVRRVPIPDAVLPLIPAKITTPLLTKNHVIAGKNLLRAMRRIGIDDERKVVYSLRHRAHDRLRAANCPPDIMREIVGHDETTVHDGYGKGYPVPTLKYWIEKIGY